MVRTYKDIPTGVVFHKPVLSSILNVRDREEVAAEKIVDKLEASSLRLKLLRRIKGLVN